MRSARERFEPAMRATDQAQADELLRGLVDEVVAEDGVSRKLAEASIRSSLGYWAGYYDRETFERVIRLFNTSHPIFGGRWPGS